MVRRGPQAAGAQQHDRDHGQRDQQLAQDGGVQATAGHGLQRAGHVAQRLGQGRQQHRAQDHAGQVADAAEHDHGDDHHRLHQAEGFGRDKALEGGKHGARDAPEGGAHAEGQQLHVAGVDAHGLGGNLVFADGHPGAAYARELQAVADHHAEQHQGQEQVVVQRDRGHAECAQVQILAQVQAEELDGVDLVESLGAVGDVDRRVQVVHEHADDFAKAQRDDGQVVTAQLERWRAQQHAKGAGQAGAQRHGDPQRGVQAVREGAGDPGKGFGQVRRGEQAVHVGADGKEGDVAQVEQAGKADHDVQAQGQQHVQQRHVGDAHPGVAGVLQQQRQDDQGGSAQHGENGLVLFHGKSLLFAQARSATRSPSRPEGRSVSMMMSTMKAKMSE